MEIKTRCITLKTIKFKDTQSIVTCIAREIGRVAFVVRDGAGREARRRRALMMAGSVFDCVVDFRETRSLQTMKELSTSRPMLIDNPVKSSVILFICDFLNALLRDSLPDEVMFDYIDSSIGEIINSRGQLANSAICFMIGLQRFMGIEPDMSTYSAGSCFDLSGGVFRPTPPLNGRFLTPEESAAAAALMRMTPRTMHLFKMTRDQRRRVLDGLLDYYMIHFGSLRSMSSLDVVRSLFD